VRVLVAACIAPFLPGGADYHIEGLVGALRQAGHEVVCLRLPFKFSPPSAIASLLGFCEGYDVSAPNGVSVDLLISLQFPAYGLTHPRHRLWLMHQHRAAYELYDEATATAAERELAVTVRAFDDRVLPMIGTRFANSRRVAERLAQFTGLSSTPLYHPPFQAERFFCAPAADYVFFPSRLETLKRQDLLIEAARHVATPVKFLLAGDGGQWSRYQSLIDSYQLGERVRLLGRITEAEKRVFYANALAVFYGPRDEDYGYVTLEAMLATCRLTVAPLRYGAVELAIDEKTALVVPPNPEAVAAAIDRLYREPAEAAAFGRAGRTHYHDLGISWARVVEQLLAA